MMWMISQSLRHPPIMPLYHSISLVIYLCICKLLGYEKTLINHQYQLFDPMEIELLY